MANQTIIGIPANFENFKQVRSFAVRLIEKLDIVLGYRGNTGYEETGTAETLVSSLQASLDQVAEEAVAAVDSLTAAISEVQTSITDLTTLIEQIQAGTAITDLSYTAPTISGTYVQAEVQGLANDINAVSDKVDELLAILRTADIIS